MSHVDGFPDRDGLDKLIKLAKAMCTTVALFAPLLQRKYPDNPTIIALIAAIATVCALVPETEAEFLMSGGNNDPIIEDPDNIAGIDPTAPPAPSPDIT